jgi:hypothetical protein
VKELLSLLGGQFSGALRRPKAEAEGSTHLVCEVPSGTKYTKAQEWGVKTVRVAWLRDSFTTWRMLPEDSYLLGSAAAAGSTTAPPVSVAVQPVPAFNAPAAAAAEGPSADPLVHAKQAVTASAESSAFASPDKCEQAADHSRRQRASGSPVPPGGDAEDDTPSLQRTKKRLRDGTPSRHRAARMAEQLSQGSASSPQVKQASTRSQAEGGSLGGRGTRSAAGATAETAAAGDDGRQRDGVGFCFQVSGKKARSAEFAAQIQTVDTALCKASSGDGGGGGGGDCPMGARGAVSTHAGFDPHCTHLIVVVSQSSCTVLRCAQCQLA